MARSDADEVDGDAGLDPLSRAVHQLGNTLHALSLRLSSLERVNLAPAAQGHVREAARLTQRGAQLLDELRRLRDEPPATTRARLTRSRNPR